MAKHRAAFQQPPDLPGETSFAHCVEDDVPLWSPVIYERARLVVIRRERLPVESAVAVSPLETCEIERAKVRRRTATVARFFLWLPRWPIDSIARGLHKGTRNGPLSRPITGRQ